MPFDPLGPPAVKTLRARLARLERRSPADPFAHGPQAYIGPCTRYSVEQPRPWRPGDAHALVGLDDWLAAKLPPPAPGTPPLFLPPQKRLVACGYVEAPGVPAGDHRDGDPDCRCPACAGWPAAAHVDSPDYLCLCDACQAAFDPPAFRQWLRVAESRNDLLGWGCKPPAPPGVTPWLFGYGPAEG